MKKQYKYFFLFFLIFIFAFSFTNLKKGYHSDEATYFAITQSIAFDFDLEYTKKDLHRIRKLIPDTAGPQGLFLKQTDKNKLYYAKSYAYPLFAAPFLLLFKTQGLLIFNGLMLLLMIFLGYKIMIQYHSEQKSFQFTLIFFLASIVPIYLWWTTPEIFNFFIIFLGLYLIFYKFKKYPSLIYLSPVLFSIAAFSKPSNLFPIAVFYLIFIFKKEWKKFFIFSIISIIATSGLFLINKLHTGEFNYQGGNRKSFYNQFPYENDNFTFEDGKIQMSADDYFARQSFNPEILVLNLFYFVFGKFTGFFIYFFPAFFILIFFWLQEKSREDIIILFSIITGILFYLIITPNNYFGGSGSVGNRYFLSLLPFFFFMGYKKRILKYIWIIPLISIFLLNGPLINSHKYTLAARWSGISFPIKYFPVEKTQYRALPTNENRSAFGPWLKLGENKYQIYFLNNHFFKIKNKDKKGFGKGFRTLSNKQTDFFIRTRKEVREFKMTIFNIPKKNKVRISFEGQTRILTLRPKQKITLTFKNLHGLHIDNSYLYLVKIRSFKSYIPLMNTVDDFSADHHGVYVTIEVIY